MSANLAEICGDFKQGLSIKLRIKVRVPVVECVWISTGRSHAFLTAFTRSYASKGLRSPDMSLMQIESAPNSA